MQKNFNVLVLVLWEILNCATSITSGGIKNASIFKGTRVFDNGLIFKDDWFRL